MKTMLAKFNVPAEMLTRDLHLLLADAIGEFRAARGPSAEEYVDRRYPLPEYASVYDGERRVEKIAEVKRRRDWCAYIRDEGFAVDLKCDLGSCDESAARNADGLCDEHGTLTVPTGLMLSAQDAQKVLIGEIDATLRAKLARIANFAFGG